MDAHYDPDNISWSDSDFYIGSWWAGDALVPSLRLHVARQIMEFREAESISDALVDGRGDILEVQAATAPTPGARSKLQ